MEYLEHPGVLIQVPLRHAGSTRVSTVRKNTLAIPWREIHTLDLPR
jgi:hypothetical protein